MPRPELGVDGAPDGPESDLGGDAARPDLGIDAARPDLGIDAARPDLAVDAAQPDLEPGDPCDGGSVAYAYADPTMVVCEFSTGFTQCDAVSRCGPGWRLCSRTEYRARGGRDEESNTSAWVGACIRSNGAVHGPTDTRCGACDGTGSVATETYRWSCNSGIGIGFGNGDANVGVITRNTCNRVGRNFASTEARWFTWDAAARDIKQVTCCR